MNFSESYFGKVRASIGTLPMKVPGARIVMENSKGEILLQLRGDCQKWGLPAGLPEEDEGIIDTLEREIFEETGLRCNEFIAWGFACSPETEFFTYPNGDVIHNYSLVFYSHTWLGNFKSDGIETLNLQFFDPNDLPEMISNHRITIEKYLLYKVEEKFQIF